MTDFQIVPAQSFKVRYHGPNGERRYMRFPTADKAIERVAWWWILDKYSQRIEYTDLWTGDGYPVFNRKPPYECTCDYSAENTIAQMYHWEGCELHDRNEGYFKRVHERLVRWIKHSLEKDKWAPG
jgi:hypothetical protein